MVEEALEADGGGRPWVRWRTPEATPTGGGFGTGGGWRGRHWRWTIEEAPVADGLEFGGGRRERHRRVAALEPAADSSCGVGGGRGPRSAVVEMGGDDLSEVLLKISFGLPRSCGLNLPVVELLRLRAFSNL